MKCKNCEKIFNGNFCNHCGQSSRVREIDLRYLLNEVPESIFQINHGFLFTVKELFTRPGHAIGEYINGKRTNYSKPIAFIILTSAIYVLVNYFIGGVTFMDDFIAGLSLGRNDTGELAELKIYSWLANNQTYTLLFLLPFYSLASYFAFKKSKYNYTEHLVLNFYITGQQFIIYTIFSFINVKDDFLVWMALIVGMFFNYWAFSQFFGKQKLIMKIVRIVLFYSFLLLQILIFFIIVVLIWKLTK